IITDNDALSPEYPMIELFRYLLLLLIFLSVSGCIGPVSAMIFLQNGSEITREDLSVFTPEEWDAARTPLPIQFFYNSNCGSCQVALEFLRGLEKKNPKISIAYHNLVIQDPNQQLYTQYKRDFNASDVPYPVIFLGDIGISGSSDIIGHTESLARSYLN
ncbi:MAG TPA: hypothetical protein VN372_08995, partial [Methanospirillum sp.]|nr:hypothetical protein [Methanospirillum sp.]